VIYELSITSPASLLSTLQSYLYALILDIILIRICSIIFGSLIEAKNNLNNCYYLTEAHSGGPDTTRDLIEEELNLLGEFYEQYDRPIVRLEESSTLF
jgi:hypothetical protein